MKTTGFKGFSSYGHRVALEMQGNRANIVGNNPINGLNVLMWQVFYNATHPT